MGNTKNMSLICSTPGTYELAGETDIYTIGHDTGRKC